MMGAPAREQPDPSEEILEPQEFERRLERLFEAVREAGDAEDHRSAGPWFAQHPYIDLTRKQVWNYAQGVTPVPRRIVTMLELLEDEYGVPTIHEEEGGELT